MRTYINYVTHFRESIIPAPPVLYGVLGQTLLWPIHDPLGHGQSFVTHNYLNKQLNINLYQNSHY